MRSEVTQAEACRILARVGLHRPAAVRVLRCGFAGAPRRVGGGPHQAGALMYEERRVWDLVVRPAWFTRNPLAALEPATLVIRSGPRRPSAWSACGWAGVDLTAPADEQFEAIRRTRHMAIGAYAMALMTRLELGHIPLVVTVGSFVAFGADVVEVRLCDGGSLLTLREPSPWFDDFAGGRLLSGRGAERRWLVIERAGLPMGGA